MSGELKCPYVERICETDIKRRYEKAEASLSEAVAENERLKVQNFEIENEVKQYRNTIMPMYHMAVNGVKDEELKIDFKKSTIRMLAGEIVKDEIKLYKNHIKELEASLTVLRNKVDGLCTYHISEVHSGNLEEAENIIKAIKQELEA
jgi:hypothetical protein